MLVTMLAVASCTEEVDAVLGTDAPFSLFGVLSPQLQRQVLRVYSIDGTLEPIRPEPLDAEVTSTALSDGDERVWRDSIITEPDGMFAHVFASPFVAVFEETYEIVARRSDGAQTRVIVSVPPFSEIIVPARLTTPPAVLQVQITGNPPNLIRVEVVYHYNFASRQGIERDSTTISYDGVGTQEIVAFVIPVQVSRDTAFIRELLTDRVGSDPEFKVVLIRIKLIVANIEWKAPGGVFDPEVLVEPGTLSNVENGFGFVGAGFRLEESWAPLDTLLVKR